MYESECFNFFRIKNELNFILDQKLVQGKKDFTNCFKQNFLLLLRKYIPTICDYINEAEFELADKWLEANGKCLKKSIKILKKKIFKNKYSYDALLLYEFLNFSNLLNINQKEANWLKILETFNFSEKQFNNYERKLEKIKEYDKYKEFRNYFSKYKVLQKLNIGVCATMSAGKSTFINALLGNDYLPTGNAATTATITSVYDNDKSKRLIGCTEADALTLEKNDITSDMIDKWNADSAIKHIYLEGDLDEISSKEAIISIHDTPGTNNSGDENHHKITFDFLEKNKMDALLFVSNIEHLETVDENELLRELKKKVVKDDTKILFVLNKVDQIDPEKEDLEEIIKDYKEYLINIGFNNPEVFPVASNAARLFKMALKGKLSSFSKRETEDFDIDVSMFLELIHLGKYRNVNTLDTNVEIGGKTYSTNELERALCFTGIREIEQKIESIIN